MKNKWVKISIIGGVVVLFIVLLYYFGGKWGKDEETFVTDDWTETYYPNDKGPYGTYVLKELLDTAGLFGNFIQLQVDVKESLEDDPDVNDIYFFVGNTNYLPDSSAEYLMDFVAKGNTAFMSCRQLPDYLVEELFLNEDYVFTTTSDSIQYLKFTHPDLEAKRHKFKYIYNNETANREWHYFDEYEFDLPRDAEPVLLGTNTKDQWNFVKIRYGRGYIFLHSMPYCFTNISMLKRDGFIYAERVIEHIPPGRVQWDRYNLNYHYSSNDDGQSENGGEERRSILEFILAHPPLVWSLLILLIGAILYAIFKGKRMQEVIPAAELKENTSLQYINTLSSLYMQHGSHSKLIHLKRKTFLNFIGERYYIIAQKPDDKFIDKVAVKSQVEREKIKEIFLLFDQLDGGLQVTDDALIELHRKIEYFYKKCR
ncbi:MAG: DUF4350 domain-containing protein [Crocinitomicaceae bacterium]|nr:DUF4350 domain-containing protein [Crocinitomicaceae bacterium]